MANNYMNNAEKAADNRSSGYTLLIVGVVGLLVIILANLGIIPIPMEGFSKSLTMFVLGILCIIFIGTGLISLKNSREYAYQAEMDGDKESEVIEWFEENFPAEKIDMLLAGEREEDEAEEEMYLKRYAVIKQILYKNFPDEGLDFQDHMADEVYEAMFGDE